MELGQGTTTAREAGYPGVTADRVRLFRDRESIMPNRSRPTSLLVTMLRMRSPTRLGAVTLVIALSLAGVVAGTGTALARDSSANITFGDDCYSAFNPTCHTVFSRSYTHNVLAPAASGTATGLLASIVGLCVAVWKTPGGATCSAIFGAYSGASQAAISQAAAQNQCAGYTTYFSDAIAVWRTDNSSMCKP
jgi:hypothetical protein